MLTHAVSKRELPHAVHKMKHQCKHELLDVSFHRASRPSSLKGSARDPVLSVLTYCLRVTCGRAQSFGSAREQRVKVDGARRGSCGRDVLQGPCAGGAGSGEHLPVAPHVTAGQDVGGADDKTAATWANGRGDRWPNGRACQCFHKQGAAV